MTAVPYSMSFTTATLLRHESLLVAELFADLGDWETVRHLVLASNRLQMRTANSSKRIFSEIVSRLRQLTPPQQAYLLSAGHREQNYLLWLAFCKRYRFVYDFAVEVVQEKFRRMDLNLTYEDYDIYFNAKAEWHPEVEQVAASTRRKQRQFVFKTMRQAELLSSANQIVPVFLSPSFKQLVVADDPAHLAIFTVPI
ncbi:MAG: DUF1819 family protein [Anaerolineales bacterium]|nr:DUF1819 family protein [Anaerolineales bacterium]